MCFAILRVSYRADKQTQTIDCASAADMKGKIQDLQQKTEVTKIGVFPCQQHIELVQSWVAAPYTPKEEAA
jgi:hypothetical protein